MKVVIKKFKDLTNKEIYDLFKLRIDVFIVEQNCPYPDIDDYDLEAIHLLIYQNEELVSYARLLKPHTKFVEASIGRVISKYRRQGLGSILLDEAIQYIKNNFNTNTIKISAQVYAIPFYETKGFKPINAQFLEDNILHQEMLLVL